MSHDHISDWSHETPRSDPDDITEILQRADARTKHLDAAWDVYNKIQRTGPVRDRSARRELIRLTNELAQELPFLQARYDSDTLKSTNDYMIVLNVQRVLWYSRDRLGMV